MQQLPYVVVTNPHINDVYNLYYNAFETFRKVKEIKTLDDNDRLCEMISETLKKHLIVIPKLAMGIHECQNMVDAKEMDQFMNTILRSVCCYADYHSRVIVVMANSKLNSVFQGELSRSSIYL
jgi:pyruvate dehydrogenase kinase 2/3/4